MGVEVEGLKTKIKLYNQRIGVKFFLMCCTQVKQCKRVCFYRMCSDAPWFSHSTHTASQGEHIGIARSVRKLAGSETQRPKGNLSIYCTASCCFQNGHTKCVLEFIHCVSSISRDSLVYGQ